MSASTLAAVKTPPPAPTVQTRASVPMRPQRAPKARASTRTVDVRSGLPARQQSAGGRKS